MLEAIMGSKTRVKILTLFLLNPDRKFYVRELMRKTGENINSVRRELQRLEDIGILTSSVEGNMKYYVVDRKMPIYEELRGMFLKVEGIGGVLKEELSKLGEIKAAFIYGSFAKGEESLKSDVDLMVVGKIDEKDLIKVIRGLEERFCREINYIVLTPWQFEKRRKEEEPFVKNVLKEKKIALIGDIDEI
ncbi:MAG: hypothetical protein DDT41_00907 [candidate division WS2 bacterium]|nr:MAG: nucleotidyltransferase domain-containing protein [Methanosarcinales archaeon Met12]MBT9130621.1 hypothetical protein [Candidatus Psychracetigena formicireducens]